MNWECLLSFLNDQSFSGYMNDSPRTLKPSSLLLKINLIFLIFSSLDSGQFGSVDRVPRIEGSQIQFWSRSHNPDHAGGNQPMFLSHINVLFCFVFFLSLPLSKHVKIKKKKKAETEMISNVFKVIHLVLGDQNSGWFPSLQYTCHLFGLILRQAGKLLCKFYFPDE